MDKLPPSLCVFDTFHYAWRPLWCRSSLTLSIHLFLCLSWLLVPDTNVASTFADNPQLSMRFTFPSANIIQLVNVNISISQNLLQRQISDLQLVRFRLLRICKYRSTSGHVRTALVLESCPVWGRFNCRTESNVRRGPHTATRRRAVHTYWQGRLIVGHLADHVLLMLRAWSRGNGHCLTFDPRHRQHWFACNV